MVHRIRRQRWLVAARSEPQAFQLSRRLRADLDNVLLPALAAGFDEAAPGADVIHLSRLELHVRIARVEDVADKLPGLLQREAAAQLRAMADRWSAPSPDYRAQRRSPDAERLRLLTRYLEAGALPWQHSGIEDVDIRALLEAAVAQWLEQAASAVRAGGGSLTQLIPLVQRLLQIVPEREWVRVAQELAVDLPPATRDRVVAAVGALAGAEGPTAPPEQEADWVTTAHAIGATLPAMPRAEVIAAVAAALQARAPALSRSDRLRLAAATIAAARHGGAAEAGATVTTPPPRTAAVTQTSRRKASQLLRQWLISRSSPAASATLPAARRAAGPRAEPAHPGAPRVREPVRSILPERPSSRVADHPPPAAPADEFALLVSHGGLILLHPYLPQLFAQTGIARAGATELDPGVLARAAALLYLLATGRAEAGEFELGFIKVLLGMPLDQPLLVADGLLGAQDREEVDALLEGVIGHWSVLRGTSADGLRASFLQRPALLREEADGWRLRVQSHAVDVLLDHLPWGIGIARLPWMAKAIFTEWQAR